MSIFAQAIYARLPPFARNWAAATRGRALRRQRYGPETDRLAAEALERDQWSAADWGTWHSEHLDALLAAAAEVPHYAHAAPSRLGTLADWPILEKDHLRAGPESFLRKGSDPRQLTSVATSGTTGKPVRLWRDRCTSVAWYALVEARMRRWFGLSREDRWANIGGQLVTPVERTKPPFWVWNAPMRQLYMSSYHLAPAFLDAYLGALRDHQIRYLHGYTSSLYALAQHTSPKAGRALGIRVALTNAEPVEPYQREAITQAFGCPVVATYGMAEIALAASECEHGALHLWPDAGILELDPDTTDDTGAGDYLCTGLLNRTMPLIRYRVGDRGLPPLWDHACPCGRKLPILPLPEGRIDDVLFAPDGRRIGRLDPVFKADLPIHEAQIAQTALDTIEVRYVPAAGLTETHLQTVRDRLRERLGTVRVRFVRLDTIPRTKAGKFRAVVCEIPAAERPVSRSE